jgi:cytochrome d ubiquinol oxidase subunit II
MLDLNIIWFILIAVLWIGFFLLEGFDFGVGMLVPFLGKDDVNRRLIINTISPHRDGNEVWLLTAGGATFAAFPQWYATMFSGFYLALFLVLVGLIVRAVGFEFRSKVADPKWRTFWDWGIFFGSFLPPLLIGVAFSNLAAGVPIDSKMMFTGNLLTLINPYGLLGGLTAVSVFLLHGAIFLSLKTSDHMQEIARTAAKRLWVPAAIISFLLAVTTFFYTDFVNHLGLNPGAVPLGALATLGVVWFLLDRKMEAWAFLMTSLNLILTQSSFFMILFPRVMISSTDPNYSLTIYNASSSPYTLQVMTIVALVFVPFVLIYQAYTYWVFRKRLTADPKTLVQ